MKQTKYQLPASEFELYLVREEVRLKERSRLWRKQLESQTAHKSQRYPLVLKFFKPKINCATSEM
jgi:hypothetical protein